MLRALRIRNLAVIEAAELAFAPGFNVLTGETGAGKSILIEAVGLLLGARASGDMVRTGEAEAVIEAEFDPPAGTGPLVLRREITAQGRSRSFIDGEVATAAALRDLSHQLVEIHGQHEHQLLLNPVTHLPMLDSHAGLAAEAEAVAEAWAALRALETEIERARMDEREKAARLDLIAFQLGEIERARPQPGEDEELAATRRVLARADQLQRLSQHAYAALYESDHSALASLGTVWKRLEELSSIDPRSAPYLEMRDAVRGQLDDLALFLRDYGLGIDASPERLQQVEDRLALLERLKKKYGPTLADVIARGAQLADERRRIETAGARAAEFEAEHHAARERFRTQAAALSTARRAAAPAFTSRLETLLARLAMTDARVEVRFNASDTPDTPWSERGIDEAEFYVSPNIGEDLRPLARVLSGGELSRVMLALKTIAVSDRPGRTLIFDEVDAGIGGRVAGVVGEQLRMLGSRFQVLCVTHLPQIAACAATQFHIDKTVRGARTVTTVTPLDEATRVSEIARMIGGYAITDEVTAGARELLRASQAVGGTPQRRKRK